MPETKNVLKVEALPTVVAPQRLAVGMSLARLGQIVQLKADENAPHFLPAQEPAQDGRGYQATDRRHYYRPQLRVAQRTLAPAGPDVRFLKDAQGKVRLEFELEESPPAGMPQGAEPFNVRVSQVRLEWVDQGQARQRIFDQPTLTAEDDPQDSSKPNFSIRAGADLAAEEVEPVYHALSRTASQAKVVATLSFGYWLDEQGGGGGTTTPTVTRPAGITGATILRRIAAQPAVSITPTASTPAASGTSSAQPARVSAASGISAARLSGLHAARLAVLPNLTGVLDRAKERERQPNYRAVTLTRSVPFTFDAALSQNRHVYAALLPTQSLSEVWTQLEFGWVRRAPFPNTVYRLPDEVRLAYNPELATPHMIPVLYRDEQEETRVRVTLRAVPWHDPDKLVKLRDHLHRADAGAWAVPTVVVGGYEEAKLKLLGAFPEHIRALEGTEVPVGLEGGFEIRLDLTLEFYKFLCELLVGTVGLTGEVTVARETAAPAEGAPPEKRVSHIPMRLNLDDLAALPVEVKVDADAVKPTRVHLVNQARAEMRIGGCVPRLVQYDANSVVPLAVFEAAASTAFPATLGADAAMPVDIAPKDGDEAQLWNAVQVELTGQELARQAKETLDRIHEVAPAGALAWKLSVECPVFLRDPVPPQFQNLYRVEVQITRAGFTPQQVVLGKGQATGQVTMQRTLREIVGEDAANVASFNHRVRNVYFDHQGRWGEEKRGEGTSLFVFPNPVEND
ncbi:MAG: hypothetical protein HY660_15025 [Armatimonadetes bacterium]|nr:hypothetical protein [Armatimonadota bacterium]